MTVPVPSNPESTGSSLRRCIEDEARTAGLSLGELTVLAVQNDPFRLDTPRHHRNAEWLAKAIASLGLPGRTIHLRGLHYVLIGYPKVDGKPYSNTDADWQWMSEQAAKAARWLGYVPWELIRDQRNAPPEIIESTEPETPVPYIFTDISIELPDAQDLEPSVGSEQWRARQPYKLVVFGEKASLGDVLRPLASNYQADLYLITGEISDTLIHRMASVAAADGRPMVVVTFADCDPAGHQMAISISRKLQAFRSGLFPEMEFEVRRAALTPEQVRQYGLPSTPLKETERRADRWTAAFGVEQTEIDALAALRPDLLRQIGRETLAPFYDSTLDARIRQARMSWLERAQAHLDESIGDERLDDIRDQASASLANMQAEVAQLKEAVRINVNQLWFELPEIVVPEALPLPDPPTEPLVDSRWSFVEQCQALKSSKSYENEDEP